VQHAALAREALETGSPYIAVEAALVERELGFEVIRELDVHDAAMASRVAHA
jgi:hypothetical protein